MLQEKIHSTFSDKAKALSGKVHFEANIVEPYPWPWSSSSSTTNTTAFYTHPIPERLKYSIQHSSISVCTYISPYVHATIFSLFWIKASDSNISTTDLLLHLVHLKFVPNKHYRIVSKWNVKGMLVYLLAFEIIRKTCFAFALSILLSQSHCCFVYILHEDVLLSSLTRCSVNFRMCFPISSQYNNGILTQISFQKTTSFPLEAFDLHRRSMLNSTFDISFVFLYNSMNIICTIRT